MSVTYQEITTDIITKQLFGVPDSSLANNTEFQKAITGCVMLHAALNHFILTLAQNYYAAEELKNLRLEISYLTAKIKSKNTLLIESIKENPDIKKSSAAALQALMQQLLAINQQLTTISLAIQSNQQLLVSHVKNYGVIINNMQAVLNQHHNGASVNTLISQFNRFKQTNNINFVASLSSANTNNNVVATSVTPAPQFVAQQDNENDEWKIHSENEKAEEVNSEIKGPKLELIKPDQIIELTHTINKAFEGFTIDKNSSLLIDLLNSPFRDSAIIFFAKHEISLSKQEQLLAIGNQLVSQFNQSHTSLQQILSNPSLQNSTMKYSVANMSTNSTAEIINLIDEQQKPTKSFSR
jgi:hypothetical protein